MSMPGACPPCPDDLDAFTAPTGDGCLIACDPLTSFALIISPDGPLNSGVGRASEVVAIIRAVSFICASCLYKSSAFISDSRFGNSRVVYPEEPSFSLLTKMRKVDEPLLAPISNG